MSDSSTTSNSSSAGGGPMEEQASPRTPPNPGIPLTSYLCLSQSNALDSEKGHSTRVYIIVANYLLHLKFFNTFF